MLIDWFTVAAQALNFTVLVWLMKRVLYKPIMAAIAAREALVTAELTNAAAKSQTADQAVGEFKRKNELFDRDRAALMTKAANEAKVQGSHMLDLARAESQSLQGAQRAALQRELEEFRQGLGRRAQQTFFSLARRALKDLANGTLEAQIVAIFCERLRSLKDPDKATLAAAIQVAEKPLVIKVAFALSADLQKTVAAAINETVKGEIPLRYEVAPEVIGGIELTAQGQRVSWSIAGYLAALERGVVSALVSSPAVVPEGKAAETLTVTAPALQAAS